MGILRVTPFDKAFIGLILFIIASFGGYFIWAGIEAVMTGNPPSTMSFLPMLPLVFFPLVAVIFVMIYAISRRKRGEQRVRDEESRALLERIRTGESLGRPLFIYLRPFSAKEERTATETLVIQLFEQRGTLVCVHESGFAYGMGRIAFRDDEWQQGVLEICERATAIVIYPAATAGTLWELGQLSSHDWLARTVFFMPPNIPLHGLSSGLVRLMGSKQRAQLEELIDLRGSWERVRTRCREIGLELPAYRDEGGLFRIAARRAEWVSAFGHEHLLGRSPAQALESLNPLLDALTGKR
jgi:hypothetical protein